VIESAARPTNIRWIIFAFVCVITVINYMQRNSIATVETTLNSELQIGENETGNAKSAFFVSYALMQIPCGWLAQRWGVRRSLTLFAAGWSVSTATLALAHGPLTLYAARALMGAFQASIFPCATLIMVAWLPPTRRALASGILNSCMLIGGALVFNLTALLQAPRGPFDWRMLFVVYAVPGAVWAIAFYAYFRNRPGEHRGVNAAEMHIISAGVAEAPPTDPRPPVAWLPIILSAALWLICLQQFCRAGANRFIDNSLSTYLQRVPLAHIADEGSRRAYANQLASIPQYVGVVSGMLGGLASDWVLRHTKSRRLGRNGVAMISLGATVLCYLPVLFVSGAEVQIVFFSLGAFMAMVSAPCAYAISMDVGGKNLPLVFGAMNMVGNFGAAAMPWVVPRANEWAGGDWRASIALFIGVHAVAMVCWFFINPDRTIGENRQ
jgi:MFS family permease